MSIELGPVLGFRGVSAGDDGAPLWMVSVLIVTTDVGDPAVSAQGANVTGPTELLVRGPRRVLRYDLSAGQTAAAREIRYRVAGRDYAFTVPGAGRPPRMAYVSCNGFSNPNLMKSVASQNERWAHMAGIHSASPYHLLLLGGDQVYADQIWGVQPFRAWVERPLAVRLARNFNQKKAQKADRFYLELYLQRWSHDEVAHMLASVPTLMMWDDHDIFDGWGSHTDAENDCPVFQGLFGVAREYFSVFQRHAAPGTTSAGTLPGQNAFGWGHVVGDVALLGLDLRSERNNRRVMSNRSWNAVIAWMDALPTHVRHLLVLSSIPVVYPDFTSIERLLGVIPGRQELEDDLRDHWHSPPHKQERVRLMQRLLDLSESKNVRVTILSGDVHVAAVGVIESRRTQGATHSNVVNQLTSSGVVHPPPPAIAVWAFENLVASPDEPIRGVTTRLMELPGAGRKLIAARNWLAIEPDDVNPDGTSRHRLWANWHVEGAGADVFTKVIHAI